MVVGGSALSASLVFAALGVPTAFLFGGLVGGLACSLTYSEPLRPAQAVGRTGQALIGISVGTLVDSSTLAAIADNAWVIVPAVAATIAVSLAVGRTLLLHPGVTPVTAAFASVAGGAAGLVSVARDLGADDRVVAVVQYLRVLLVLVSMPLVVTWIFHPPAAEVVEVATTSGSTLAAHAFAATALVAGLIGRHFVRVPAAGLLLPMACSALLSTSGLFGDVEVPIWAQQLGYLVVGAQVGLRFTRSSLAAVSRMLPLIVGQTLLTITTCAGIGMAVAPLAGVSQLDAYLAMTPGGLYASVGAAVEAEADAAFVLAVQVLRLFAALAIAPILARLLRPPEGAPG